MLPVFGDFIAFYVIILVLRIFNVPAIREIEWKWFLIIPIVYFFLKLIFPFLSFAFYFAVAIFTMYGVAYFGLWVFH